MNSPKDYITDRQQKEKEMEQAEKMLIDTFGEEKARKLILDMKIGGILAGLQTNFMDLDTAQKKLLDLIQQSMEVGREEEGTKIEETSPSYQVELSRLLQHLEGMEFLSPTTRRDIEILVIKTVRQQVKALLTSEVEKGKLNALEKLQNRYKDVQSVLEEGEIPHYMGILELEIEKQRKVLSDIGGGK